MSNKMKNSIQHIKVLKKFVSASQILALANGCRNSEEKDFFFDKIEEISNIFSTMPRIYEQDGKGDSALVYLHYFMNNMDWYVLERNMEDEDEAYAFCNLGNGMPEIGYINLSDLTGNKVELDLHWDIKTLGEAKTNR